MDFTSGERVGDAGDGGLARHAVEHEDEVAAGHVAVRVERAVAAALDDAVAREEVDGVGGPLAGVGGGDVVEDGRGGLLRDGEGDRVADTGRRGGGRVSGVGQGHGVEAARCRDEVDAVDALDRVRVGVVIVAVVEAVGVAHERTLAGDGAIAVIQLAHCALRLGERDVAHAGVLGGDVAPDGGRLEVGADHRDHVAVVDLDRHRAGDGLCGSGTIVVRAVGP